MYHSILYTDGFTKNAEKCRKMPKNAEKYVCEKCDFRCSKEANIIDIYCLQNTKS